MALVDAQVEQTRLGGVGFGQFGESCDGAEERTLDAVINRVGGGGGEVFGSSLAYSTSTARPCGQRGAFFGGWKTIRTWTAAVSGPVLSLKTPTGRMPRAGARG